MNLAHQSKTKTRDVDKLSKRKVKDYKKKKKNLDLNKKAPPINNVDWENED